MEMVPKHPGIDLIIADTPSGLPVPIVSPNECPSWNEREKEYFENLFCFGTSHLTDFGCILLMHPKDRKIERLLDARAPVYGFRVVRDWWGYNPLPMASTLYHQKQVLIYFCLSKSIIFILYIRACVLKCLGACFADSQFQHQGFCSQNLGCKIQNQRVD